MKRFGKRPKRQLGPVMTLAVFSLVLLLFLGFLNSLSADTTRQQRAQLEAALNRGIITCYTLEGRYPESLQYLQEHYPLHYNENLFFVDYQVQGANMLPDVTIIERRGGK